jgi:hypothetical protein
LMYSEQTGFGSLILGLMPFRSTPIRMYDLFPD